MPDSVVNCQGMFGNAQAFNQNIKISNNAVNCASMFYNAISLNQCIQIPDSVVNCEYMFMSASALNQPIKLSNSVQDCSYMFTNATRMTYPIHFPANANYLSSACENMPRLTDIYIYNSEPYLYNIANGTRAVNLNIHCANLALINGSTSSSNSVVYGITYDANLYNFLYKIQLTTNMGD